MNFLTPEQKAMLEEGRDAAVAALAESVKQTALLTEIRNLLRGESK